MKTLAEFFKTTLIGGVLVILPVYVAILLLAKMVGGLLALLAPVTAGIPAGLQFRQVAAILLLVVACFVVGLIVRTGPGLRAKNACERAVLERLPAYGFLRGLARQLTGHGDEHTMEPCLAEIEEALVPAFIVEDLGDGQYTVLVPSAPTPGRQHLHPGKGAGAPGGHSLHQGDRRVLEVGDRRRRLRAGTQAATGRTSRGHGVGARVAGLLPGAALRRLR